MPAELRPDRCGVIVSLSEDHGAPVMVLHVHASESDLWRKGTFGAWLAEVRLRPALKDVTVLVAESGQFGKPPRYGERLYEIARPVMQ